MEESIKAAASLLARSSATVALTGSGISRESGILTFREQDGLWERYRPEDLATLDGFLRDPELVWRWYMERLFTAREKSPNPGHYALASLEGLLPEFVIVTQNVDDLHRKAGSRDVIELHGNIERFKCLDHAHPAAYDPSWGDTPPRCHCGSMIRPDVVWFGEALPQAELSRAFSLSGRCDVMLVVGTSGLVSPASDMPLIARESGAAVIEVNIRPTRLTPVAGIFLEGPSGTILPALSEEIENLTNDRSG